MSPRLSAVVVLVVVVPALSAADKPAPAKPPAAPAPTPTDPKGVPADLADWTPRPATGKAEPWEKATDKDWADPRFRATDTGPFFDCTLDYPFGVGKRRVFRATAVRLGPKGDAAAAFDRNALRLTAGWTGGFLNHSDRRFGLLNTPTPAGPVAFAAVGGPGWASPDGRFDAKGDGTTGPLPTTWGRYRGLHLHDGRVAFRYTVGDAVVLESPGVEVVNGVTVLTSDLRVGPSDRTLSRRIVGGSAATGGFTVFDGNRQVMATSVLLSATAVGLDHTGPRDGPTAPRLVTDGPTAVAVAFPPAREGRTVRLLIASVGGSGAKAEKAAADAVLRAAAPADPTAHTRPGPPRWGKPLVTRLDRGAADGPFAVDTLTIPHDNPHKALFFCTGLDFLPDGRVAVCTAHGDVWLVTVDEAASECRWQRFAAGLYHPLGLKVVGGRVVVLERGQLTRLHDANADGEADFYECLADGWHVGGGEHAYHTCLETDPAGNFYFFCTGDPHTPTGGCLMRVSADGRTSEVFATGFRHPIGLGMSPTGVLTGADQEGNWMPATRIDAYKKGGFYGDLRAHHRATPPATYDPPLCWLPREVDNSAGGQVWVPDGVFGPLGGRPIHLSYGRCKAFVLLTQEVGGVVQGGVADLGLRFQSGVCRGRFDPARKFLYVCGLNGWQTAAKADGCLQRVRYTGNPLDVPVALKVVPSGVELTFSRPLDPATATDPDRFRAAWWGYRWSKDYGSKRYKVSDPSAEGQDEVPVSAVTLLPDRRTVRLTVPGMRPVMQMQIGYNVAAADGKKVVGSVYLTAHKISGE